MVLLQLSDCALKIYAMVNFFVKAHGLGNEYIVLDSSSLSFALSPSSISKICNIHYGLGSDGILLKVPSEKADFGLRIFNPDGSEAEKSGNGLRIFSKFIYDYGHSGKKVFTVETLGGVVTSHIVEERSGKAFMIKVEMGKAIFTSQDIPVRFNKPECFSESLSIEDKLYTIHCVSVGNPHCVILMDHLDEFEIKKYGPLLENHPMFPNRINVQFVKVISDTEAEILIWERGAGYTLASGSSSSAVASVLVKKGLTKPNIKVRMPGGTLDLEIAPDGNIFMTGEVREVASGNLSAEFTDVLN